MAAAATTTPRARPKMARCAGGAPVQRRKERGRPMILIVARAFPLASRAAWPAAAARPPCQLRRESTYAEHIVHMSRGRGAVDEVRLGIYATARAEARPTVWPGQLDLMVGRVRLWYF